MSTDEQQDARSGSVPNAFGNALAWRWMPQMPASLKRSNLHTLLYAMRTIANASGELRFHSDRQPMRIRDIARAAGCDEKDCRDRLEAARRAGVVAVKGERRRGRSPLYTLLPTPCPDWAVAVAYLEGVKAAREEARQKRAAQKGTGRRAAPWSEENGGRSPELNGPENGGPPPELTDGSDLGERGTAPRTRTGDRPPNGSGDRPPNNPGGTHVSTHDGAEVSSQPQPVGGPGPQDHAPHDHHTTAAVEPPPAATAGRCHRCHIPLIRPGRNLCHGCETYHAAHPTDPERTSA